MRDISLHKIKERKFRLSSGVDITLKKYCRVFQDDRLGRISEKAWVVEYTWLERKEHPNASEFTQKVGSFPCGHIGRGIRKLRLTLAREMDSGLARVDDALRPKKRGESFITQEMLKAMPLGIDYAAGPTKLNELAKSGSVSIEEAERAVSEFLGNGQKR